MTRARRLREVALPHFYEDYLKLAKTSAGQQLSNDFVAVFTQIIDQVISEDDVWLTFNRNSATHQPNFTLHEGKAVSYATGREIEDLLRDFLTI